MARLSLRAVHAIAARIAPVVVVVLALAATGGGDFPLF